MMNNSTCFNRAGRISRRIIILLLSVFAIFFITKSIKDEKLQRKEENVNTIQRDITATRAFSFEDTVAVSSVIPICADTGKAVLIYRDEVPFSKMEFPYDIHPMRAPKLYAFKSGQSKTKPICALKNSSLKLDVLVKKFDSCAIIGSSGILLNSGCGQEIDKHDFVMRSNMAPINCEYSKDVGTKSDFMAVNFESIRLFLNDTDHKNKTEWLDQFVDTMKYLNGTIMWFPKDVRQEDMVNKLRRVGQMAFAMNIRLRMAYSWKEKTSVEKTWKIPPASLGFMSFATAHQFCSKITLYGFYPFQKDAYGKLVLHHYYDKEFYIFSTPNHNMSIEFDVLQKLHKEKKIQMVLDKCKKEPELT